VSDWPPNPASTWPDLARYKAWARVPDDVDDARITESLEAATAAVKARATRIPVDAGDVCPPDVAEAVLLWTNRLVARANSPTGVVGTDDMGQALIPGKDPDIRRLISPWSIPVLA
jgi:hypothetical protein